MMKKKIGILALFALLCVFGAKAQLTTSGIKPLDAISRN